ncbi:hypothetical protein BJ508DRAFT_333289 [Ascobolus immersus RN42]|uniref:Uncharacterized protein n=1 Tax=Ascobolus immersus RN42 TaxID=1160509 RepID=A0A3N4HQ53_ASCIM|nr:hypothetical protein BJ508DRAFT_333289 [Ascobolus immersus RN42]
MPLPRNRKSRITNANSLQSRIIRLRARQRNHETRARNFRAREAAVIEQDKDYSGRQRALRGLPPWQIWSQQPAPSKRILADFSSQLDEDNIEEEEIKMDYLDGEFERVRQSLVDLEKLSETFMSDNYQTQEDKLTAMRPQMAALLAGTLPQFGIATPDKEEFVRNAMKE